MGAYASLSKFKHSASKNCLLGLLISCAYSDLSNTVSQKIGFSDCVQYHAIFPHSAQIFTAYIWAHAGDSNKF